jgi:hypothetical protein
MEPRWNAGLFLRFFELIAPSSGWICCGYVHFCTLLAKYFFYFTANFQKTCNFVNNNLGLKETWS